MLINNYQDLLYSEVFSRRRFASQKGTNTFINHYILNLTAMAKVVISALRYAQPC
jgi:hypothetical protein